MSEARAAGKAGPSARNEAAPAARYEQGRRCGRSPGQAGCYRNRAKLRPSGLAYVPAPLLPGGQIAQRLFLGETTVKTHVTRILTKLHLRDRVQAVVLAHEPGLVRPGGDTPERDRFASA